MFPNNKKRKDQQDTGQLNFAEPKWTTGSWWGSVEREMKGESMWNIDPLKFW
jgi:hypothetical protein